MDSLTQSWVNDYLDLYNYARTIEDSEWAEDILRKLRDQKDALLEEERKAILLRELLISYDRINKQGFREVDQLSLKPSFCVYLNNLHIIFGLTFSFT